MELSRKLKRDFLNALDPGEREALAILHSKHYQHFYFATADRAAIRALGILSLGVRGFSVEELVQDIGKRSKQMPLSVQYTKKWFKQAVDEGFLEQHLWLNSI